MPNKRPSVEIQGKIVFQTQRAYCVKIHRPNAPDVHNKDLWFPFSHVDEVHPAQENEAEFDKLVISEWIAKQKGIL